jgi:hypothetical protein
MALTAEAQTSWRNSQSTGSIEVRGRSKKACLRRCSTARGERGASEKQQQRPEPDKASSVDLGHNGHRLQSTTLVGVGSKEG